LYKVDRLRSIFYSQTDLQAMNLTIFSGLLLISAGAFSAGSFSIPFGMVRNWKWETYWFVYSFGAYILFPILALLVFVPGFVGIYKTVPSSLLMKVFLLGAVYGIGNLSFGLSLRYLGISLGYSLSLGLILALGTLIPPVLDGRLRVMIDSSGGNVLIAGVIIACIGIAVSGIAGYLKDKLPGRLAKDEEKSEFNFVKGILAAILVGITGSAMALGMEQGQPVADIFRKAGTDPLFTTVPVMLILLSGTLVTTIIWCLVLGLRERSLHEYLRASESKLAANYIFSLAAGMLWFLQFIFFSMGKSKMGPFTFTSWGILVGLTIVVATLWGIYRKEWKGAPVKIYAAMIAAMVIIIISSYFIGISGSV
jgi:L-rhamnose-H+ transport protein